MDDFIPSNLTESRNEWCSRLIYILTPLIVDGIRSIFNESWQICQENEEPSKYLMTFQNLLSRIHKWNHTIIEEERKRIVEKSGCNYLEDLITCVHIIQLKVLTCIRVGNKQKKIDVSIPKLDDFIHKVYIHVARKVYSNVYLFEKNIPQLQQQRNIHDLEIMIQECIMVAIRESIPTEAIIRSYLDESMEHEEEIFIEKIPEVVDEEKKKEPEVIPIEPIIKNETPPPAIVPVIENLDNKQLVTRFEDNNKVLEFEKDSSPIESISTSIQKMNEPSFSELSSFKNDDEGLLKISSQEVDLTDLGILDIGAKVGNDEEIKLDFDIL
jgi:hypothetical protein